MHAIDHVDDATFYICDGEDDGENDTYDADDVLVLVDDPTMMFHFSIPSLIKMSMLMLVLMTKRMGGMIA